MRALALAAVVAAIAAGAARADVFAVVPPQPVGLPSAELPNAAGTVSPVPFGGTAAQLSYPQLVALWQRAGAAYGIPWRVLGAINKVESNYGRNMGPSSAGAIGWMQFMPSTWERWGVDADGDGIADPWDPEDAVFAAARYLAASGGRADISRAVFSYNHAQWYVDEVLALADRLDGGTGADAGATFAVASDPQAEHRIGEAEARLAAARRTEDAFATTESRLLDRAESAPLLSDRLDLDRLVAQAAVRHSVATDAVARARSALRRARVRATASPFFPFGAAPSRGRYVFPVGGGASQVSVAHTHHDYPAADIAAPEGSAVYALTNGTVLRAWRLSDSRCGIGFTMQAWDGREWTYCHLSALEPAVVEGAPLAAGQSAGRVGQTGHATGPHLHLQLKGASVYPQSLPWFESFAGTAFRWQDAPTPAAAPVFAVVPNVSFTQ